MNRLILAMAAALAAGACGDVRGGAQPAAEVSQQLSSMEFSLSAGPTLADKYLLVEAVRMGADAPEPVPAETVYPCRNSVAPVCIPFGAAGIVSQQFDDLCPSTDVPMSAWRFKFAVFGDRDCTAESMVTGDDFSCYDSSNLASQRDPNVTWELLVPGCNTNSIVCVARNPVEYRMFSGCSDLSGDYELASSLLRLDCGCYSDGAQCVCPTELGFPDETSGCSFSEDQTCKVVCPYFRP